MESISSFIQKLEPFVFKLLDNNQTGGHDIHHFKRVMNLALFLQSKEGGDPFVIAIAAYLHDIHRLIQNKEGRYVKPVESLPEVKRIIKDSKINLTAAQLESILFAIEHHEDYNWDGHNVEDLNTLILQDADNLDAIGAIGIARAFQYAGVHHQVMYDETIPFVEEEGYEEKIQDVSTIHFFHNKLVKLGKNMNTNTAKDLAKERITFIHDFIDEFMKEWNSNY